MYSKALIFAPVVCLVAPAMAEDQKEEAPTAAQVLEATKALINGATEILDVVKDEESANVAAAGIDQLTVMAKAVSEATKNLEEPSEEEQKELAPMMKEIVEAQGKLGKAIEKVLSQEYATDTLKAAVVNFGKAFAGE